MRISFGEEEKAASIIVLQRVVSMFVKSKQQIIREQLHLKPQKKSKSLRQTLYHNKKEEVCFFLVAGTGSSRTTWVTDWLAGSLA